MKTRGEMTTTVSSGSLEQSRRACQEPRCVHSGWINDNPAAIPRCLILPNGLPKHYDDGLRLWFVRRGKCHRAAILKHLW